MIHIETYFQLTCRKCKDTFKPLVCTLPGELLQPDYELQEETAGYSNLERLKAFHKLHQGHELVEEKRKVR